MAASSAEVTPIDLSTYLEHLSTNAPDEAIEVVDDLLRRGVPVRNLLLDLVRPAQERLGLLWLTHEWSTVQEHRASAISNRVLDRLDGATPPPKPGSTRLIVACVREEWHSLPARLLAGSLRQDGFDVKVLGANTPTEVLLTNVRSLQPKAVLLSASLAASVVAAQQTVAAMRELDIPVIVGGSGFRRDADVARRIGASAIAEHPDEVPALLDSLDSLPDRPLGAIEPNPFAAEASFIEASRHWLTMHAADEACGGADEPRRESFEWFVLAEQLPFVFGSLAAAVLVEQPRLYRDNIAWFRQVLHHRRLPTMYVERAQRASLERLREAPHAVAMIEDALLEPDPL